MYESIKNGKFALKQAVRYTKEGKKEARKQGKKERRPMKCHSHIKKMNPPSEIEEARSFVKKNEYN